MFLMFLLSLIIDIFIVTLFSLAFIDFCCHSFAICGELNVSHSHLG